jgi:adenylyl-sulfate kinase
LSDPAERSPNVTWHAGELTRQERWARLGGAGATVWFTGLSGSGKSSIAAALEGKLLAAGRPAYLLDGDNLRHGLNGNLGFSAEDRSENIRRTAHVARLFADAGTVALVSLVSPYAADRDAARALHEEDGLAFIEVWVATPVELCEQRDPKGLYAKARAGELQGLTGVDDPYEPPARAELRLSGEEAIEEAAERVLALLPPRAAPPSPGVSGPRGPDRPTGSARSDRARPPRTGPP